MYLYRRLAIVSPRSVIGPSPWASAFSTFENLGHRYVSESLEMEASLDSLRLRVGLFLIPEKEGFQESVLSYHTRYGFWELPCKRRDTYSVLPQPNGVTCTLACAWMKMLDLFGEAFFLENKQISSLNNNFIFTHFEWVLGCLPIDKPSYRVLATSFRRVGQLQRLLHCHGSGAIGIQIDDERQHWVMVDRISKKVSKNSGRYCYHVLSVRDPASCSAGAIYVVFKKEKAYLLTPEKSVSSTYLLGDFTTVYR